MAYQFTHYRYGGSSVGAGAAFAFVLKEALKAAGWVVTRSSDGSTYYPSSDGITHEGGGAGGMSNNRAWYVVRQPGVVAGHTRELCVQRMIQSSNEQWRVKWAVAGSFSGGAPAAQVVPTADDQQLVWGGGTDASPTFTTAFNTSTGGYAITVVADAVAPYGFCASTMALSGRSPAAIVYCDPVQNGGVAVDGDSDPYVVSARQGVSVGSPASCHIGHGTAGQAWVNATTGWAVGSNPPPNPDGRHYLRTPLWSSTDAGGGVKGLSTMLRTGCAGRITGETLSVNSERDFIIFGEWALPWDGSVPVVT